MIETKEKQWGRYNVLYKCGSETKVKELLVEPGKKLSLQRHIKRSEMWMVAYGIATVWTGYDYTAMQRMELGKHQHVFIPVGHWHRLENNTDDILRVIEIQYGTDCVEEDIERIEK